MNRFGITQQMHFSYGHRLLNYTGKCTHLHGHNGLVELVFESEGLDPGGMVVDLGDVKKWLRSWLETNLDHQMILRKDDPLVPVLKEMKEPCYLLDVDPTVENLAKEIFHQAEKGGLPIVEVRLWETPARFASYRRT